MPHALLLSPDDQAVNAITAVLEEMSVTCERPLDGVSAAKKLNSQSFDMVLVDCENLPAAKLIFDVCRRGKDGNNPVPIAIVDGRAGLPTAFRLGAELILTKPVAKDQARSTIRTAVSRVRKDALASESLPAQPQSAATPAATIAADTARAVDTEERAHAAAASSRASSQMTSSAHAPSAALPAPDSKMSSALDEIDATSPAPQSNPQSAFFTASRASGLPDISSDRLVSADSKAADWKSSDPANLSDDPVLAEIERTEAEALQTAKSGQEVSAPAKATPDQTAHLSDSKFLSSYQQSQHNTRTPLLALLLLVLVVGGFYAAWTYQPGFQEIVQPQIDRVLTLIGMPSTPTPAPHPVKPSPQVSPSAAKPGAQTAPAPADSNPASTVSDSVATPAIISTTGTTAGAAADSPAPAAASIQPPSAPVTAAAPAPTPAKIAPKTAVPSPSAKPDLSKPNDSKSNDSKKDQPAASSSSAPLPWESGTVILSSKGAEKRLAHSVAPKFSAEARAAGADGTVVLKELVDQTGKVEGVRLVEGDPTLAPAAIQAVKQWRYRPFVRDGKALPFQTIVTVDFQHP